MTPRDREIVRWIGRHRFVTAAQVAERFGVGRSQCYARLTGLVRLGLLRHERLLHGEPGVYLATTSGLQFADVALPPATVDLRMYDHDLDLVSLLTGFDRGGQWRVHTERELRAIDTPAGRTADSYKPQYAVLLGHGPQLRLTPSRAPRVHFPDAVIIDARSRVMALELERTPKGRARLRGILRSYVAARHLTEVHYYVTADRVEATVAEEVAALRAEPLFRVVRWAPAKAVVAA